jgi:alpha-L-rhamnosidase
MAVNFSLPGSILLCFLVARNLPAQTTASAEPLSSPLAVTPDPLGTELQRTFISAPPEVAAQTRGSFVAYRRTFTLAAAPRSAKLHLFADARYLVWLNGQPVHRGPNRFDIRGPEYDTVNLSGAVHAGSNTIAIVVMGNGGTIRAVNDGMGQGHNARMMKHAAGLTVRLEADDYLVLKTDDTWKWSDQTRYRPATIDWAKVIDVVDARVEDGDWTLPDYDDRTWKSSVKINGDTWGPLSARRIPPLRDTPVAAKFADPAALPVTLTVGQQLHFSMGRLVQAYTLLVLDADAGTELTLDYAGIAYTAKAGRQTYISTDTCAFDGGTITVKSGRATLLNLKLVERLYPFDRLGSFKSNDPLLNRLWDVCARGLEILSEDAYVDCADRERAEWMDCDPPAFDLTRTAFAAPGLDGKPRYADARLLGEMLRRTALTLQKDGWVKAHTTSDRFDIHAKMEDRACDWVQGARRYLESTGDAALIREIWPVVIRQLDYFLARRTPRGLVLAREWVVWGNPVGYVTSEGAGLNAFVYKALTDAAYLGNAIGETRQASRFAIEAKNLASAFNTVLWDEAAGTYYSGYYSAAERAKADDRAMGLKLKVENDLIEPTMFSALWALDQEIVPADRRARVTAYLLAHRTQADRIMTFYYLFKQMYAADTNAFDREILQIFRARWKGMAESPWQTPWEEFRDGSKAHCYGMFPGYFLSAYVLGVRPELPASSSRLLIEPHLGDLISAEGVVVTEYGPVPISWKTDNGVLRFHFEVPSGVTATLRVPQSGAGGKLILHGQTRPVPATGRFLETQMSAGLHEGRVEPGL